MKKVINITLNGLCLLALAACAVTATGTLDMAQVEDLRTKYPLAQPVGDVVFMSMLSLELEQIAFESDVIAVVEVTKVLEDIKIELEMLPRRAELNKIAIEETGEPIYYPEIVEYHRFAIKLEKVIWENKEKKGGADEGRLEAGGEYVVMNNLMLKDTLPVLKENGRYVLVLAWGDKGTNFEGMLCTHPDAAFYVTDNDQVLASFKEEGKAAQYSGMLLKDFTDVIAQKITEFINSDSPWVLPVPSSDLEKLDEPQKELEPTPTPPVLEKK